MYVKTKVLHPLKHIKLLKKIYINIFESNLYIIFVIVGISNNYPKFSGGHK